MSSSTVTTIDSNDTVTIPRKGETRNLSSSIRSLEADIAFDEAERSTLGLKGDEVRIISHERHEGAIGTITATFMSFDDPTVELCYVNLTIDKRGNAIPFVRDFKLRETAKCETGQVITIAKNPKAVMLDARIARMTDEMVALIAEADAS